MFGPFIPKASIPGLQLPGWEPDRDIFHGTWGNDSYSGGDGDDIMWGSIGADTFFGGNGSDTVNYSRSHEAVFVDLHNGGWGFGGLADGDRLHSVENVIGSAYDDRFYLDAADNTVRAGLGDDFMTLSDGADVLDGGGGIDTVSGRGDGLTINLATGTGSGGILTGDRYISIENVLLQGDYATIIGGAEDNEFHIEGELSTVFGGGGNDVIRVAPDGGVLDGGSGIDRLYAGGGSWGSRGVTIDLVAGEFTGKKTGAPVTTISNFEHLLGTHTDDTFIDGADDFTFTGGLGEDIFVFEHAGSNERDVILDFDPGVDKLDLSATRVEDYGDLNNGGSRRMEQDGSDTVIHTAGGNEIVLANVNSDDLLADSFLF